MTPHLWHEDTPAADWDELQNSRGAHVLQGSAWAQFQKAQGKKVFYAHGPDWSWLAVLERGRFGSRLYCPYGPTVSSAHGLQTALVSLLHCATAEGVTYIRVEPQGPLLERDLRREGLKKAHRTIQPRYTFVKNLTKSEDLVLADMQATNRNLHRTAAKKGLSFRQSTAAKDVTVFLRMMHEVAKRNNIQIHSDQYYKKMIEVLAPLGAARLFFAELDGKPVAASIVLDSGHARYYAHAASTYSARKYHPGTPLVSHMIFDAKKQGLKAFDFYGIAPPDKPDHPWAGLTKFKKSFGGKVVDRHGTWELPVKKLSYAVYRTLTKLGK